MTHRDQNQSGHSDAFKWFLLLNTINALIFVLVSLFAIACPV